MKPFKYKNEVSFGDFKSAMEAARAVDAAFYYYDKNKWRNFCDSPKFLPPLPGALDEEGKLKFVKEQARSLAFLALLLPSTWDPANRCEEFLSKSIHPVRTFKPTSEPGISDHTTARADHDIPAATTSATSTPCNLKAIQEELKRSQEALDALQQHNCAQESASLSIEAMIRSETVLDLVDMGSQATAIRPLTKTSTPTILEAFPEIPDVDELDWNPIRSDSLLFGEEEYGSPLDVNDYIEMVVPILKAEEHSPVIQGSTVFTLQL